MKYLATFSSFLLLILSNVNLQAQWVQTSGTSGGAIKCFAVSGTNIFAGNYDGGVYLSTNNGNTWTAANNGVPSYFTITALAVNGINLFAGTNGGGVYLSSNNGTTWNSVNNGSTHPDDVTAFAVSGINLFAGTYGGGIYLSTNNGTSWTAVNNGLTNSTILSLTVSGKNIFAGISGGVFLSTNNGTILGLLMD